MEYKQIPIVGNLRRLIDHAPVTLESNRNMTDRGLTTMTRNVRRHHRGNPEADPGFQVRGALKIIAPSGVRREIVGVFRVKNHDFTQKKKSYFCQIYGGRRVPLDPPLESDAVNQRTDNTMAKRKTTKQTDKY